MLLGFSAKDMMDIFKIYLFIYNLDLIQVFVSVCILYISSKSDISVQWSAKVAKSQVKRDFARSV